MLIINEDTKNLHLLHDSDWIPNNSVYSGPAESRGVGIRTRGFVGFRGNDFLRGGQASRR